MEANQDPRSERISSARKPRGSLARILDRTLDNCAPSRGPGRPKDSKNIAWTPEADNALIDLFKRLEPATAKAAMRKKLVEAGYQSSPESLRKCVEYRIRVLGLAPVSSRNALGTIAKPWSQAATSALLGSLGESASLQSIAQRTRHTVKAVRSKLARLGRNVEAVRGSSYLVEEIADKLQVTRRQVRRWKEKGWLKTTDRRLTDQNLEDFLADHANQIDFHSLGKEVQLWLLGLGYPAPGAKEFHKNARAILADLGKPRQKLTSPHSTLGETAEDEDGALIQRANAARR